MYIHKTKAIQMFKYLFFIMFLLSCSTTAPYSSVFVCTAEYNPHLCTITIDDALYAGYGLNRCNALKSLEQSLKNQNQNPLLAYKAQCGKVYK